VSYYIDLTLLCPHKRPVSSSLLCLGICGLYRVLNLLALLVHKYKYCAFSYIY